MLLSVTGLEMDETLRAAGSWDARRYANSASPVLRQTCARLRLSHSYWANVTAMFRAARARFDCSLRSRGSRLASRCLRQPNPDTSAALNLPVVDQVRCSAACRAAQAEATISSTECRICQSRSRAARSPVATIRAGSPGRRGRISGVKSMPVTRATPSMIWRTDRPLPLPRL